MAVISLVYIYIKELYISDWDGKIKKNCFMGSLEKWL